MSKADGTILFSTELDNSELAKQVEEAKSKVKSLEGKISELNKDRTKAVNAQIRAQEKLNKAQEKEKSILDEQAKAADKAEKAQAAYRNALKKQSDILREMKNTRGADAKNKLQSELDAQSNVIAQAYEQQQSAVAEAEKFGSAAENAAQQVQNAQSEVRAAADAVSAVDANLDAANAELEDAERNAGDLENDLKGAQAAAAAIKKPIDAASKAFEKFGRRVTRIIASALIFNVLRSGIKQLTSYYGDIAKQNSEFAAQLSKLKGAFYAAFQPIYEYVLPAVVSLMKVLTSAMQVVGVFFSALTGKSYSQMVDNAKALYDQANATEELGDAAKKASKYIAGFDELNVMPGSTDSSSTVDVTPDFNLSDEAFGVDLDEWSEKLQPVADIISNMAGAVESMSDGILAIVGVIIAGKAYTGIKNLWKKIKALGISKGITGAKDGISGIGIAASALAGYFEWSTIKDAVADLALGSDNAAGKIVAIGVAAAAAAKIMCNVFGPYGLVIAAVVGLAGAIAGVNEAQEEMMEQMADEAFYSGTGTKISELGIVFENLATSIAQPFEEMAENKKTIDNLKTSIGNVSTSIGGILRAFKDGYKPTEEEVEKLTELFGQLNTDTKEIMGEVYNNLYNATVGSLSSALTAAGSSSGEILAILNQIRGGADEALGELDKAFSEATEQFQNGTLSLDEYSEKLDELLSETNKIGGIDTKINVYSSFEDLLKDVGNIDWENETARNQFFEDVTEAAKNANSTINEALDGIEEGFKQYAASARAQGLDDIADRLEEIGLSAAALTKSNARKELKGYIEQLFDAVQKDIILKAEDLEDELKEKWNGLSWYEKLALGFGEIKSEDEYVKQGLEKYIKNQIDPINDLIEGAFTEIGVAGSAWASDAMEEIMKALFKKTNLIGLHGGVQYEYKSDLEEEIEKMFDELGVSGSEAASDAGAELAHSMMEGLVEELKSLWSKLGGSAGEVSVGYSLTGRYQLSKFNVPGLAEGRVLPANQPFLAMVGDQKHGTNVEAPLSVIQEAVAEVMGDMLPAMVAGFEALLSENQLLRAAVEGIEVGDSTIGQAANRYNQRMAIIRG